MHPLLIIFLIVLILSWLLERILDSLNSSRWGSSPPELVRELYDDADYLKAKSYDQTGKKFSLISDSFSLLIMLTLLLTGAFGKLDMLVHSWYPDELTATLVFFGIIALGADLLQLPFDIYKTFVIEQKFGFNKKTPGLFISDRIKGYILGGLIGGSLIALFSLTYQLAGPSFWIYAWVTVAVLLLLTSMFYTTVLLPIFNKLSPLADGELKQSIVAYCTKTGFAIKNLMVMDGSKRSSKANAFFSGIGAQKKIVLFDTLIANHSIPELVAVLAHETGHYKLKHTQSGLFLSLIQTGLMFFIFSIFIQYPQFAEALGSNKPTLELGLLAFGILYGPVSMALSLATNFISRKHEYEADAYATKTYNGAALQEALKKLSVSNLSNPDPHPAYVFFYYSHPPLLHRLRAIEKVIQTA
jgi:STE24 endopeptidase